MADSRAGRGYQQSWHFPLITHIAPGGDPLTSGCERLIIPGNIRFRPVISINGLRVLNTFNRRDYFGI